MKSDAEEMELRSIDKARVNLLVAFWASELNTIDFNFKIFSRFCRPVDAFN